MLLVLLLSSLFTSSIVCEAFLIINEVAYKGSSDICNGEDWIELYNNGTNEDLLNYTLHDDKGKDDDKAKFFNASIPITAGEYLVLCRDVDFAFGIGSDDVVTLLNNNGDVISEVMLLGSGDDNQTFAFFNDDEEQEGYQYTASPTPGEENVYTKPKPLEEKLYEQNEAGDAFFLDEGDEFDKVVDLHVQMSNESLATIVNHPTWEEFVPFTDVAISNPTNDKEYNTTAILTLGAGKIRTKGQSTLMITACLGLRNVPFQIEFDTPFMGMEIVYLRNHLGDQSYMRDYASHVMLQQFGLPYLRSRPVRLFVNDEYIGFYTLLEAPVQAYVMQRSFGVFNPEDTALYKVKTQVAQCPVTDPEVISAYESGEPAPNPYYFERGDHRADIPPFEGEEILDRVNTCLEYFRGEMDKEGADLNKGILYYNNSCGIALTSLGRVDRDYGPKSTEVMMVNFIDSVMFNTSVTDIKPYIDKDQWIKNFAAYAVTLNQDSVIDIVNNWYLATVNGEPWEIVQYDHNSISSRATADFCGPSCKNRIIYHPILRPSCGAVEDHPILGRVLNDEESWQTYLKYVKEFVGVVESTIEDLRSYGEDIKMFIVDDPFFASGLGQTVESYEKSELALDYSDYNTEAMPLLKTLSARLDQVKAQLDEIETGTLPRDGQYGKDEKCPDWRDVDGSDYLSGSQYDDSCGIPDCAEAAPCYDNSPFTCMDGTLVIEGCKQFSPFCDSCYPSSSCGSLEDPSGKFVQSDTCGELLAGCKEAIACFDHKSGICAYDGEILIEECNEAAQFCKACFPDSRCGDKGAPILEEEDTASTSKPSPEADTASTNKPSSKPSPEAKTVSTSKPSPDADTSSVSTRKTNAAIITMGIGSFLLFGL